MDQQSNQQPTRTNIMSYPELRPVTPPKRKYRTFKIVLYGLVLVMIGFFVYSNYIKSAQSNLTATQTESTNEIPTQTGTDANKATSYWGQSTTPVPTYPPITTETDLSEASGNIDIPDFTDQITSLKELIAK